MLLKKAFKPIIREYPIGSVKVNQFYQNYLIALYTNSKPPDSATALLPKMRPVA
mgnify:FL=1